MKHYPALFRRLFAPAAAGAVAALLALAPEPSAAQAPPWHWAHTLCIGNAAATALDAAGNVYVTGRFSGTATFGATTLTSAGGDDIFIAKLTSGGAYEWAVQAGGAQDETGLGLVVDAVSGEVLVSGSFDSPSVTFGATQLLNSGGGGFGNSDAFVAKLSTVGAWQWATRLGGSAADAATSLAVDRQGMIYVTGKFVGGIVLGTSSFFSGGGADMFVAQLDATGRCLWGERAGGLGDDTGTDIAVDGVGNVYLAGTFLSPDILFGTTTITNNSPFDHDLFVAKLTPNRTWQWAVVAGGSDNESVGWLAVDRFSNVYVSGGYRSSQAYFGPFTLNNSSAQNYDIFVAKLNVAGSWQWAVSAGSPLSDFAATITLSDTNNPVVAGMFAGTTATFGTQTITNSTTTGAEVFVAQLSPTGNWGWAVAGGGGGADFGTDIAIDNNSNVYVVGRYGGQAATFGATQLTSTAASFQSTAFVARLGSAHVGLAESAAAVRTTLAPNPAHETVWVTGAPRATAIRLLNALGREVARAESAGPDGTATLDVRALPAGLYLVQSGAQTQRLLVE